MPSSEKLFTLDPLKTSLTKPTTDVKVQGPANRSVENSQLLQGLKTFGNAVGSLAEVKKQKQLTEDTLLAQNAAIKGEAEPSGIFGVASEAYDRIIEANTLTKAARDMQTFIDGPQGSDLVNAGGAYSENIAAADKVFDTFKAYGAPSYLNPQLLNDFYNTVERKRNKVKTDIALVNRDRNRSQVIQRIANTIEATVDASKDIYSGGVESDSSDIEGTDEYPILFSLDSNITPELHNTLASDTVALNMGIKLPEAQRLVLQMFLQNETVIAQPSLADKLMSSEYSPGVTYEALYIKGSLASNTDKDAADIFKMRNVQIQASIDYHKALDDQDKADAKTRTDLGKSFVIQSLDSGGSNAEAYQIGFNNGLRKDEITTLIKAQDSFEGNLTFGTNTPQGQAFKKEILAGKNLSEAAITVKMRELNLDPAGAAYYKGLASLENKEIRVAQEAFDSEIKIIKEKTFQLLKGSLNNNSAKVVQNADGSFDFSAMMSQMAGGTQGLDSNEVQDVILRLQRLQNDYEYRSNEAAREVARSDTFDRADVTKFGDDYNKAVSLFISDLEKNIISKTQVRDARKKEEADKKAAKAAAEAATKEPVVLPKPTVKEQVEEQQEILKDPAQVIRKQIESYEAGYIPYDMSVLKEIFSGEPPPKSSKEAKEKSVVDRPISESEQLYLKNLEPKKTEEQAVPTAPPEEYVSKTGLGPVVDAIDAGFDKVGDIFRERTLQKGLDLFFDIASSGDYSRGGNSSDPLDNLSPTDTAEVPAGGGSEEQLVGKGLSEPGPTPTPEGSHRVQRGETLSSIAQNANTTVDEIAKLNNITDPQKIQAGAMLKLPDPTPLEFGGPIPAGSKSRKTAGGLAGRTQIAETPKLSDSVEVEGGDNIGKLSKKTGFTNTELISFNNGSTAIFPGKSIDVPEKHKLHLQAFKGMPANFDVNRFKDLDSTGKVDYVTKINTTINPILKTVLPNYKGILSSIKSDRKKEKDLVGEHGTFAVDYSLPSHFTAKNLVEETTKVIKALEDKDFVVTKTTKNTDYHRSGGGTQTWFKVVAEDGTKYTFEFSSEPSHVHIAPNMDERLKQHWPDTKRTNVS